MSEGALSSHTSSSRRGTVQPGDEGQAELLAAGWASKAFPKTQERPSAKTGGLPGSRHVKKSTQLSDHY